MTQTILTACWHVTLFGVAISAAGTQQPSVERFGFYEATFEAQRDDDNPYTEVEAEALLQCPDGTQRRLPLFWDGGHQWKLRLSPDVEGRWNYHIESNDPSLNQVQGSVQCVPSRRAGGIQVSSRDPHHFQRQDGTPFLFWGDTAWALYLDNQPEQLNQAGALHYVDLRAAEGINVIHSMLLSEAGWGNSGGPPFRDLQHEVINPEYWQEVDRRLRSVNDKGITAGLVLGWGDKGGAGAVRLAPVPRRQGATTLCAIHRCPLWSIRHLFHCRRRVARRDPQPGEHRGSGAAAIQRDRRRVGRSQRSSAHGGHPSDDGPGQHT